MVIAAAAIGAGGSLLSGILGQTTSGRQSTSPTAEGQLMNIIRASQLKDLIGVTGGNATILQELYNNPNSPLWQMNDQQRQLLGTVTNLANDPGQDFGGWYGNTAQHLDPTAHANLMAGMSERNIQGLQQGSQQAIAQIQDQYSAINPFDMSAIQGQYNPQAVQNQFNMGGMAQYSPTSSAFNPNTSAYSPLSQMADPNVLLSQQLGAARDNLSQIVAPQLQNQMALSGLGRSGAAQEALSKAATQMALPISQQVAQNAFNAQMQQQQLYGQSQMQQAGLYGQGQMQQAGLYGQGQLNLQNILAGQQQTMAQTEAGRQQNLANILAGQQQSLGQIQTQQQLSRAGQVGDTLRQLQQLTGSQQQQNYGTQADMQNAYLQNLFQLNMASPSVGMALRNDQMNRAMQGIQAQDMQRQMSLQRYNQQLAQYNTQMGNAPYSQGGTTTSSQRQQDFGFGDAALPLASMWYLNQRNKEREQEASDWRNYENTVQGYKDMGY